MKIKTSTALALAALAAAAIAGPAAADVLFDSHALGEPLCAAGGSCDSETRSSDANYAAVLQFSADVTVDRIGVWSSVDQTGFVKFVIFDSALNGGTGDLLFSQTKAYFQNLDQTFLYTDDMSFTFQSGHTYDVGIVGWLEGDATLTGRWIAHQDIISGPVHEISRNANIGPFADPQTGGYSGVSPWVELDTAGGVPEPASWALMIGGFGLAGAALRRRRTAAAAVA
jgi:PEP-CTERM motif